MCFDQPYKWMPMLPAAEWWYNTSYHTALKMSPFQALYGYNLSQLAILEETSHIAAAKDWIQETKG